MILFAQFFGLDGFLGTRASFMLDVVFLAMFAVVPVLAWSIYLVRNKRNYALHKRVQLALGIILGVAVLLFEIDMRITGWRDRAIPSAFNVEGSMNDWIEYALAVHLFFAIPTALLWIFVIVRALSKFDSPPVPNAYSRTHRFWAWIASFEMLMTSITGWIFYYLAFVA